MRNGMLKMILGSFVRYWSSGAWLDGWNLLYIKIIKVTFFPTFFFTLFIF